MDKKERIKEAYQYLRGRGIVHTQQDIANIMKKPKSNISRAFNGHEDYLTEGFLADFYKKFSNIFNEEWIINGEGPMLLADSENNDPVVKSTPTISYTHGNPYYNVDFLGGFDIILNDQTINPEYLIDFKKYADADCWCNISGHSMEPLISNGDIIAIKQINDWREFLLYGETYGIVTNDMRTVKIVTKSDKGDDYIHLIPVNKSGEYQPQDLPKKLITHVFRVLGCMKKL